MEFSCNLPNEQCLRFKKGVVPLGMSRPNLGIGMDARIGISAWSTFRTAGKNNELNNSILPTSSMTKRSVPSLTCNSGNASDSNDAISTLYFPTVGHLRDSAHFEFQEEVMECSCWNFELIPLKLASWHILHLFINWAI